MGNSNEIIKKELNEKSRVYKGNGKTSMPFIILLIIIMIYAFFFTSKLFIKPPITSSDSVTKIGEETEFAENRTYSLVGAKYSSTQEMMEIILQFSNYNYDNVNEYYYTLTCQGASTKKMVIKEVFNEDLFTVIRISNVPADYAEMEFMFAPKVVEANKIDDSITGSVVVNENNVKRSNINTSKSKEDYYKDRLLGIKSNLEAKIEKARDKLKELNESQKALEAESASLKENKKYMTSDEVAEKEATIKANEERLLDCKLEQRTVEDDIQKYEKKLAETVEKINAIEKK